MARRLGIVLLGGVLVATLACSHEESEPEPLVSVQVAVARREPMERVINSEAVLYPVQQAAITPKISAPVKRFYVNRGGKVHKGELLATLENQDLVAATVENKGALQQAEAAYATTTTASLPQELQKAELDVKAAKQALDAQQKLYDSRENLYKQGALPRKDLDQSRVTLTEAQNAYDLAEKNLAALQSVGKQQEVKSAAGQLQSARGKSMVADAQLSYSEIRSPINGVVTERPYYAGEMVNAGTPLLVVMDTSTVIAKAHIPQEDAALVKVGDAATISVPGAEDKIPARITVVSPATDPNSTTVEVWARAANSSGHLRPGTTVQVSIEAQRIPDALAVPESAVLTTTEGGSSVMVVGSDGRAHRHAVTTGVRQDDKVQILSGIQASDRVIATGAYGLPDNSRVQVQSSGDAGKATSE